MQDDQVGDGHGDHFDAGVDVHVDEDEAYVRDSFSNVQEYQTGRNNLESRVISTAQDAYPNWNLLPSGDFLRMSNTETAPHEKGPFEEDQVRRNNLESTVVSIPRDAYPNWNLLPPGDFLRMSNTDVAPHEKDQVEDDPPLSYPVQQSIKLSPQQPLEQTPHEPLQQPLEQ